MFYLNFVAWTGILREWASAPPIALGASPEQEEAYLEHWGQLHLSEERADSERWMQAECEEEECRACWAQEVEEECREQENDERAPRSNAAGGPDVEGVGASGVGDRIPMGWAATSLRRPHRRRRQRWRHLGQRALSLGGAFI